MSEISINNGETKPYFVRIMNKVTPFHIDLLKCIALIAMIADHANDLILPEKQYLFYSLGRLAMPLFIFIWAWNMAKQPCRWELMARRQWIWAIIAQPFFAVAFYKSAPWYAANILFVFALVSQVASWVNRHSKSGYKGWVKEQGVIKSIAWVLVIVIAIYSVSIVSYGLPGIALLTLTLLCFLTTGYKLKILIPLWWGALFFLNISLQTIIANPLDLLKYGILPCLFLPWFTLQIIDNYHSNREKRFMPRQAFYWLYSGHLGLLAFIAWILTGL
ncbi:conjugal transfer protein TraX [Serratia ficaria]|uniref:conjugal transfer protein TraX n=1 Tax=Serratia ficaria TaxID=61651 RepID=UPI002182A388|nr:conjugal transfer protein TraX [Serratia ficaria]CAI2537069.1 conjugal transfer protein TrbP [Serratia ficaria]